MGHADKKQGTLCDALDELELAIRAGRHIRVHLKDGSTRAGLPQGIEIRNHEDVLLMEGHLPIRVDDIQRVEKLAA